LEKERKTKKKSRRRRLVYWLLIDLIVAASMVGLLLYKPSGYNPVRPAVDPNGQPVHPYLYRDLASQFYNNAQGRRPFTMVVLDKSLNQAIAQAKWPQESAGIVFTAPQVVFGADGVVLMGTATVEGADFVVTIELDPQLDEKGFLNIRLRKFKVGAMNVTLPAKIIAHKMYKSRLEEMPSGSEDLRLKIVSSLLDDTPFDPVFEVEDKWVRLKGLSMKEGRLAADFVPAQVRPPAR